MLTQKNSLGQFRKPAVSIGTAFSPHCESLKIKKGDILELKSVSSKFERELRK